MAVKSQNDGNGVIKRRKGGKERRQRQEELWRNEYAGENLGGARLGDDLGDEDGFRFEEDEEDVDELQERMRRSPIALSTTWRR